MPDPKPTVPAATRRNLLGGAATVGAAAIAATALPLDPQGAALPAPGAKPAADPSTGYRLTDHIKQYYAKARF